MRGGASIGLLSIGSAVAAGAALFLREVERAGNTADAMIAWTPTAGLIVAGAAAAVLVSLGWHRRVGHAPHCARCGYERNEGERLIVCCPECGSPWRWIGWTVQGRPVSRPGLLLGGLLLGLLTLTTSLALAAEPRLVHQRMPERLLVLHAAAAPWYANLDGWREIRERRLSKQNEIWLASQLLEHVRRNRTLGHEAMAWLDDLNRRGRLPLSQPGPRPSQGAGL